MSGIVDVETKFLNFNTRLASDVFVSSFRMVNLSTFYLDCHTVSARRSISRTIA